MFSLPVRLNLMALSLDSECSLCMFQSPDSQCDMPFHPAEAVAVPESSRGLHLLDLAELPGEHSVQNLQVSVGHYSSGSYRTCRRTLCTEFAGECRTL